MFDCTPDPMGDACFECAKMNCCDQAQDCAADPECSLCLDCVETSGDPLGCAQMGTCDIMGDPRTGAVGMCIINMCGMDCGIGG
jgi:hypothetical protein